MLAPTKSTNCSATYQVTQADLDKAIEQLTYMARTLREVQSEQSKVVYLQAAE